MVASYFLGELKGEFIMTDEAGRSSRLLSRSISLSKLHGQSQRQGQLHLAVSLTSMPSGAGRHSLVLRGVWLTGGCSRRFATFVTIIRATRMFVGTTHQLIHGLPHARDLALVRSNFLLHALPLPLCLCQLELRVARSLIDGTVETRAVFGSLVYLVGQLFDATFEPA